MNPPTPSRLARIHAHLSPAAAARRARVKVRTLLECEREQAFSYGLALRLSRIYRVDLLEFLPRPSITGRRRAVSAGVRSTKDRARAGRQDEAARAPGRVRG